jgi:hypothetical protein
MGGVISMRPAFAPVFFTSESNPPSILASRVKFVEYQSMNVESLKKQVELMRVLVAGCKKHPAYRAIRPATGNCEPCVKMWNARLELNSLEK